MEGLQALSLSQSLLWTLLGYSSAAMQVSRPVLLQVDQAQLPSLGISKSPSFSTHTLQSVPAQSYGPSFPITMPSCWGDCIQIQQLGCGPGG